MTPDDYFICGLYAIGIVTVLFPMHCWILAAVLIGLGMLIRSAF